MAKINGDTLISWGFEPGAWFKQAILDANKMHMDGFTSEEIISNLQILKPAERNGILLRTNSIPFGWFIEGETEDEKANMASVLDHMDVLMRVPTIRDGAVMPDACPSGSQPGTIPVGGVVACEDAIHPGFHSADICCSMAISVFKRNDPVAKVLDAAMKETHFGPVTHSTISWHNSALNKLIAEFAKNPFLKGLEDFATDHFMTQGDGNHFLYVGELESTGEMAIVTHHGSRGLGGGLYRRGKQAAERHTKIVAGRIPMHQAWIKASSQQGEDYWAALQILRQWTKLNHFAIHDAIAQRIGNRITGRFWNEHNFVFQKSDGLFYHAKGATPAFHDFADDSSGMTLIPLNMAQPILLTKPSERSNYASLNFAPHGAGRNMSRTAHLKRLQEEFGDSRGLGPDAIKAIMDREVAGLDVRFYTGTPDVSELPSAYKNATEVQRQIEKFNLANIVDRILPRGSIMAGEMNWNRKR